MINNKISIAMRFAVGLAISTTLVVANPGVALAYSPSIGQELASKTSDAQTNDPSNLTKIEGRSATTGGIKLELPGTVTNSEALSLSEIPAALVEGHGGSLLNTELPDASISTFATERGSQTIIKIHSPAARHEYRFPLTVPVGTVSKILEGGSIEFSSKDGAHIGSVKAPWAHDANGAHVPTSFVLDGMTLVQTIDHSDSTAYPVIADPSTVWGWTTCVASVGVVLLPWGAGAKVAAKLVTRFGSVQKGVKAGFDAWHRVSGMNRKWSAAMAATSGLFAELMGIKDIKDACFS